MNLWIIALTERQVQSEKPEPGESHSNLAVLLCCTSPSVTLNLLSEQLPKPLAVHLQCRHATQTVHTTQHHHSAYSYLRTLSVKSPPPFDQYDLRQAGVWQFALPRLITNTTVLARVTWQQISDLGNPQHLNAVRAPRIEENTIRTADLTRRSWVKCSTATCCGPYRCHLLAARVAECNAVLPSAQRTRTQLRLCAMVVLCAAATRQRIKSAWH